MSSPHSSSPSSLQSTCSSLSAASSSSTTPAPCTVAEHTEKNKHSPTVLHKYESMDDVKATFNDVMKPLMPEDGWAGLSNDSFKESAATFLVITNQHLMILTSLRRPNSTLSGPFCRLVDSGNVNTVPDTEATYNPNEEEGVVVAKAFANALDENHTLGQRVLPLIRKGGDEAKFHDDMVPDYLHAFLERFPEFSGNEAVTAFKDYDEFATIQEPLMRFQAQNSRVCAWVALFNHLFYSVLKSQTTPKISYDDAVATIATNISRFMRNTFPPWDLYDHIFVGNGAWPYPRLVTLLQEHNPGMDNHELIESVNLRHCSSPERLEIIKSLIELELKSKGSLLIERFHQFSEFEDPNVLVHSGDFKDMTQLNLYHSLLIVGSIRTNNNEMGGMKLWLQDSIEKKPFAVVGLDLLLSMESVTRLLAVPIGLKFTAEYPLGRRTAVATSGGSPSKSDRGQFFSSDQICTERTESSTPTATEPPSDYSAADWLDPYYQIQLPSKKKWPHIYS